MTGSRTGLLLLAASLPLLCLSTRSEGQVLDSTDLSALRVRSIGPVGAGGSSPVVRAVSVDMSVPFRVYAALEDAGAWVGPSSAWRKGGLRSGEWTRVGAGQATSVLVDPRDERFVHSAARSGDLTRYDRRTAERKGIRPWAPRDVELRFGEAPPLVHDPFRPELVYVGTQFVHRTPDQGSTWQIISGDLTAGGSGNTAAISSIAPSPVQEEVLWVGTGDGRLHLTRSSGGTWTDLTTRLPGGDPSSSRISHVEASRHHGGTAFVSVDRRGEGDRRSYLYRTGDYGQSWERLGVAGGLEGVVHVVEQDPVARTLLFAGTSRGLYVSSDGGARWLRWPSGLPSGSVHALLVHPRDYDLVVGAESRGVHVLDDMRPLRALARDPGLLAPPLHLFDPPPAYLHHRAGPRAPVSEEGATRQSRPYGALLTYHVGSAAAGDSVSLEVVDEDGRVVRRMGVPGSPGLNRASWNLGIDPPGGEATATVEEGLPLLRALPGRYTVRLRSAGGAVVEARLRVLPDPRSELTMEERVAGHEALIRAIRLLRVPAEARERLDRVETAVKTVLDHLSGGSGAAADTLRARGHGLTERARRLRGEARSVSEESRLPGALPTSFGPPTESQRIALQELEDEMAGLAEQVNDFLLGRISLYNDRLRAAGLEGLPDFEEIGRSPPP